MQKMYAASGNLFTSDSWNWQSFVSSYDVFKLSFFTGCTKWNIPAIKILLLFMSGLFIGFLVEKCSACRSHRKSDFGWHRFQKWAYSTILALFDGFQELHLHVCFNLVWTIWAKACWLNSVLLTNQVNPSSQHIFQKISYTSLKRKIRKACFSTVSMFFLWTRKTRLQYGLLQCKSGHSWKKVSFKYKILCLRSVTSTIHTSHLGWVAQSMVSFNHWLSSIKTNTLSRY